MTNPSLLIDPALFADEAISEETRTAVAMVEEAQKRLPTIMELGTQTVRDARKSGEGLIADEPLSPMAEWRTIKANGIEVPVRQFVPDTVNGLYLHIHGGGHTIGAADSHDQMLSKIATDLNMAVVSVEYRLAPENPWPLPADDCEAVSVWLAQSIKAEYGTEKIVIGGESAGAHLSAVTLLRMREHHQFTDFAGANLVYGIYDMSLTPSMQNWGDRLLILNRPVVEWFGDNLFPPDRFTLEEKRDPLISPINAPLHDMPRALFTVGTLDPLLDDSLFMAQRWLSAGHHTELEIYPGGIHAFDILPIKIARQARQRINKFIAECIAD